MSEYTNEPIQKEDELENLGYFLDAYKDVTGETLELLEIIERPDFICSRENGSKIGIELTKVTRGDPSIIQWAKIIEKQDFMSSEHAIEMIQKAANVKEEKRIENNWKLPEANILLIVLVDIPLAQIRGSISQEILPDLYSTGFMEVWLADFTGLEAYDNIELLCVRPEKWAGYYSRGIQKPYG
jgi:hypothetical protein